MVAVDFLVVPTIRFKVLYVFIIISHTRREVVHFNVTKNPTTEWTARQIVEAFPWDTAPKYFLRDRDNIFGIRFRKCVQTMGIEELLTAFRSPWQKAFVERLYGSIPRECTDLIIVLNTNHLRKTPRAYFKYYHVDRTHLGLDKDPPQERPISNRKSPITQIVELPRLGGLHHRYEGVQAA